jgi:hypothetical protein
MSNTETRIHFEVAGDVDEDFAFQVTSETAPGVGDAVLHWIDMPGDWQLNEAIREGDEQEIARIQRMRRALFIVTRRQFEVREMQRGKMLAYWFVTMRHATPEEMAAYSHRDFSNATLPIEQRADASELSRHNFEDGVSDTATKAEE